MYDPNDDAVLVLLCNCCKQCCKIVMLLLVKNVSLLRNVFFKVWRYDCTISSLDHVMIMFATGGAQEAGIPGHGGFLVLDGLVDLAFCPVRFVGEDRGYVG